MRIIHLPVRYPILGPIFGPATIEATFGLCAEASFSYDEARGPGLLDSRTLSQKLHLEGPCHVQYPI